MITKHNFTLIVFSARLFILQLSNLVSCQTNVISWNSFIESGTKYGTFNTKYI